MRKCPKCGYTNNNYRDTCFKCGTDLLKVEIRSKNRSTIINILINPLEPIWLEIFKWYIVSISILILISSFFLLFIYADIVIMILAIFGSIIHYIIGMVVLNVLYNLQQSRINTDKIVKSLEAKQKKEK